MRIGVFPLPEKGSNPFVYKLSSELSKLGHEIFDFASCFDSRLDILWLNWFENFWLLKKVNPQKSNIDIRNDLFEAIKRHRRSGVRVFFTMHNVYPHNWPFGTDEWFAWASDFYKNIDFAFHMSERSVAILDNYFKINSNLIMHPADEIGYLQISNKVEKFPGLISSLLIVGDILPRKNIIETLNLAIQSNFNSIQVVGRPKDSKLVNDLMSISQNEGGGRVIVDIVNTDDHDLRSLCSPDKLVILNQAEALNSGVMFFSISNGSPVLAPNSFQNNEISRKIGSSWVNLFDNHLSAARLNEFLERPITLDIPSLVSNYDVAHEMHKSFINI